MRLLGWCAYGQKCSATLVEGVAEEAVAEVAVVASAVEVDVEGAGESSYMAVFLLPPIDD